MTKKVIQVPIDEELLVALDHTSRKQKKARAELIREACQCYLTQMESEELDRSYQEGYRKMPEGTDSGEGQTGLAGEILLEEKW
jgi:metal-responsive CopG/Arc/MetJ family transcriptional regulator